MTANQLPPDLVADIVACGYFPEFVIDSVALALGADSVVTHLVHHEANFSGEAIQRHLTVMVLTPVRLLVVHTDEGPGTDAAGRPTENQAVTSSESIALASINSVALSRVVGNPERFGQDDSQVVETWLTMGWGTMRRLDLEPAGCSDPNCMADHGYTGTMVGDDITVRMSPAADGAESVARLVAFTTAVQRVVGANAR